ncbi:winged helix-turn-helix transcriptional regulator [Kribbella sp. CA-293567]|uniref:winged helix-turn-helix transcriptional regulator n=1 Tax=Kribbella sp. CA-293567 TaxID=3002436 RepID=UPI0022DDFDAF|nr:helix-turn-helix domain-containing protein [Kribbella sp. CA-293567]WBQ04366.1 helix-turn-helix domain-containing protein [Kribbella sp. CA-293567]
MRGSSTGRPIMAVLDLLGRRWMLRVLWELRDGAVGFRDLRARCDQASPTVLHSRLSELKAAGLVTQNEARAYYLTPSGNRLYDSLKPLRRWAEEWSVEFGDDH